MNVAAGTRAWPVARAIRALAVAVLAGAVAGVLVGGVGSRVAMRIVAMTTQPTRVGLLTDNGNVVGDITLEGTIGLVLFGGLFSGIVGGLLYLAARPWLAGLGRWRGLAFGLLLFAAFGYVILDPENRDFLFFGSPVLNVALFAALFPSFGAVIAPAWDGLDRALPALPRGRPVRAGTVGGYLVMAGAAGLGALALGGFALQAVVAVVGGEVGFPPPLLPAQIVYLAVGGPLVRRLPGGGAGLGPALMTVPVGLGLVETARAIAAVAG